MDSTNPLLPRAFGVPASPVIISAWLKEGEQVFYLRPRPTPLLVREKSINAH
jgi:hypothetical protein